MRRFRSILVAIKDPAAPATPALKKAAQLASGFDATLELFHDIALPVWPELLQTRQQSADSWQREVQTAHLAQLERLAAPLRKLDLTVHCAAQWDHPPHEAIIRHARKCGADLIAADRHPGSEPMRWLFQYTDWELLRLSPVPVLIAGGRSSYDLPTLLAAVDPMLARGKPRDLDDEIVGAACLIANALHGKVRLIHATAPASALVMAGPEPLIADVAALKNTRRLARSRVTRLARRYQLPQNAALILNQFPELAVLDAAKSTRAAIVVLGAVGRSALKRLAFGSTAERLIARLPADLLVVKPADFQTRVRNTRRGVQYLQSLTMPV